MSPRAWFAFLSVSVLWGIPYLFIKVVVDDGVPPAFLAWARVTLAAVVLLGIAWRFGLLGQLRGHWRWLAAYAAVEIAIPFPLIGAAEQRIPSSLAAILIATVPLIVALLALRFDQSERVDRRRLIGLLIGFAGVVALVGIDVAGNSDEMIGTLMMFGAAIGYAAGPMILKRKLSAIDPRPMMGASLAVAAVLLTPAALIAPPESTPPAEALASMVFLGLACTALAFVLFAMLNLEVGPSRASVITYVAPVVAVGAGIAVLSEKPGTGAIAGLLLIIAGSWISTDGRLPPSFERFFSRKRGSARRPAPSSAPAAPR